MVKRFLFSGKAGNWGKFGKEKNEGRFGKLFFQEFSQDSPDFLVDFTEKLKGTRKMDDGKEECKTQFFMKSGNVGKEIVFGACNGYGNFVYSIINLLNYCIDK